MREFVRPCHALAVNHVGSTFRVLQILDEDVVLALWIRSLETSDVKSVW